MNTKEKEIYSEVYGVLDTVGDSYKSKIPEELLNFIKESSDENKVKHYDIEKNINDQNISIEALAIVTALNLMYFADEEDKKKINFILKENDEVIKNKTIENKSIENAKIDAKTETSNVEDKEQEKISSSKELAIPKKIRTFKKVWNFIKRLFGRK